MTIRMLVNATAPKELRIAIVEDGELTELDIEASEKSTVKGNIYKGKVRNVEGSLEAAFVDFGQHKQGFLPFSEIAPEQYYRKWDKKERPRITDVVRRDQDILVQVSKDAVGDKGATLSTFLSLPGRYVVIMPNSDAGGISRKIEDEKVRRRIRAMAQKLVKPEGCGFIVRTAGLNQTRIGIQKDLDKVTEQLGKLREAFKIARAPSILHAEPDLIARTLRDYFNEDIDEVWIDTKDEFEAAYSYFRDVMPELAERIKLYENPIPVFAYHHVEEQIESTFERRVSTPSGCSIVIDQTEALVAIDVNSGKMTSEGDHESTVFKTNTEAAEEIARQLKLRDLGGIVVIDFIDMEMTKNKRSVENTLLEASKDDKARWKISRINSKGLCVLTRQRIRQGMRKAFQQRCEVCDGTGWVRTSESHSLSLLRRIETRLAQGGVGECRVRTHRETVEYLSNYRRRELLALEREYHCRVVIVARPDIERGKDEVQFLSKGELLAEITDKLPPRERRDASRRKKRKKRPSKRDEARPAIEDSDEDEEEDDGRKRKRRSKSKDRDKDRGRDRDRDRGRDREPDADEGDTAEAPPALEAKGGTTFTGRPSPQMLAKLKAERKYRMERAKAKAEGRDPDEIVMDEVEAVEPEPEPAVVAEDDGGRRSSRSKRGTGRGRSRGRGRGRDERDESAGEEVAAEAGASSDVAPEAEAPDQSADSADSGDKRGRSRRPNKQPPKAPDSLPETVGAKKPEAKPADTEGARTRKSLLDRIFGAR